MAQAFIALGTNVGERLQYLQRALVLLDNRQAIQVEHVSSIYETDPVGYTEQRQFLNMVAEIDTDFTPHGLLSEMGNVESQLGRERTLRWGPRTIDLDILLYNQEEMDTEALQIPHSRMEQRAFVLVPLAEINPGLSIPGRGPLLTLIQKTPDKEGVRLWKQNRGEGKFGLFES